MNERIVFLGNLPDHVREAEIESLLEGLGAIREIDLKLPPRPPPFAFVEFVREEDAREAVRRLDGTDYHGFRLRVQFAKGKSSGGGPPARFHEDGRGDRKRLYVDYLPPGSSWQDLKDHFRSIGRVAFADVYEERGRLLGVVEFDHPEDAIHALRSMDGTLLRSRYESSRIRVMEEENSNAGRTVSSRARGRSPMRRRSSRSRSRSWERPGTIYRDAGGAIPSTRGKSRGYRVLFDGLPTRTSWQDLKDFLRPLGPVAYTDVHEEYGRVTGVAEFDRPEDAREAARSLDGTTFRGRVESTQIRVWEEIPPVEKRSPSRERSQPFDRRSTPSPRDRSRERRSRSRSLERGRGREWTDRSPTRRRTRSPSPSRRRSWTASPPRERSRFER